MESQMEWNSYIVIYIELDAYIENVTFNGNGVFRQLHFC